ncbi:iron-containing alcohol dehydrogenase [Corynebacterium pacaense]|uniref:iron-containing alcohol dehydrogenase n=1 Tax=Corynebacterium pacaense TaxID=1816684 RepID=UPI0009BC2349|nr:iron-containing alcohol dehydrogenase [Corynebacterium pacaense]
MTLVFHHTTHGQQIHFGAGRAAENLRTQLESLGSRRILLIVTRSAIAAAEALTAGLPVAARIEGVAQHVPLPDAQRARALAVDTGADVIVSIGGGSAVGLAKAIVVEHTVPIIAVPTTYAASEGTDIWAVTRNGSKEIRRDARVVPVSVIYDAGLLANLPGPLAADSGLNGVAHCIDTVFAGGTSPISRELALAGLRSLAAGLPGIAAAGGGGEAPLGSRESCLYGGYLGAVAYSGVGRALHHEIVHVLGGSHGLAHARTHAVMLPYVSAVLASWAPDSAARIAVELGGGTGVGDGDPARVCVDRLLALCDLLVHPSSLAELGLAQSELGAAVARIVGEVPAVYPRPVTVEVVADILGAAFSGADPRSLLE